MKNETIKTYTEITPLDGLKLLVENDGKPVDGLAYTLDDKKTWEECTLEGYDGCYFKFRSAGAKMNMRPENCAKVTELDLRNFQEPDAFEEYANRTAVIFVDDEDKAICREFYELGQANPTK